MAVEHVISKNTLADLKLTPGTTENVIITLGQNTKGDGLGALYYWDSTSTDAEESVYWSTVIATGVTTGRWKKVFNRIINLPHGLLLINSGVKEFFCSSTTGSDGTCSINLTFDNTTNGTAIFNRILFDDSKANVDTTTVNDMVNSCRKSLSANLKQLVHIFGRGNNTAVTLLGVNVLGIRAAVSGTPVIFSVKGM